MIVGLCEVLELKRRAMLKVVMVRNTWGSACALVKGAMKMPSAMIGCVQKRRQMCDVLWGPPHHTPQLGTTRGSVSHPLVGALRHTHRWNTCASLICHVAHDNLHAWKLVVTK